MDNRFVFSWAENAKGHIVHIDSVPRGLACNCYCPYCHEKLMARHGNIKEHGFAHHSETRGANLEICYMVTLYKLAEQTIQTHKRIRVPSYYDIFKEKDMEFLAQRICSVARSILQWFMFVQTAVLLSLRIHAVLSKLSKRHHTLRLIFTPIR